MAYSQVSKPMKILIKNITIEKIEDIIKKQYFISSELLKELFLDEQVLMNIKEELLVINLPYMDVEEVPEVLTMLDMQDYLSLLNMKRPIFEDNSINRRLLEVFSERQWITKYKKETSGYIRANGRKII